MHRLTLVVFALLLTCATAVTAQNANSSAAKNANAATTKKHSPIFRASKDQITQAQNILKQRGFYNGAADGKLTPDTRAGRKKYQAAEGLKVTGTLNALTLEKMSIPLTDKQKEMTTKTTP